MKTSQKVILGCAFAVTMVSGLANAAGTVDVSQGPNAIADPLQVTVTSGDYSGLVQTQFLFMRSRNVAIATAANGAGTGVAISTASAKGRNTFFANSAGFASQVCGKPAAASAAPALWAITAAEADTAPDCTKAPT
jgi:hypothetical protein